MQMHPAFAGLTVSRRGTSAKVCLEIGEAGVKLYLCTVTPTPDTAPESCDIPWL